MILDTKNMSPQMPIGYLPHPQPLQHEEEPVSRTYQYRKVMKPMLERKRRARINRCLDELKELMVTALQAEGENVSKLEKADILELTVRHLHGLKRRGQLVAKPEMSYAERFRAGFTHCATEVSQFITNATLAATALQRQGPVDPQAGARLLQHLSSCIRRLDNPYVQQSQAIAPNNTDSSQTQDKNNVLAQTSPSINSTISNQFKYQEIRGSKRPADSRPDGSHAKQCYAPPSPPHSPALSTESLDAQSQSMWRPW